MNVNYKMIMIGDAAVGKTSLIYRYISNIFMDTYASTTITSFVSKRVKDINLNIWDSAGQERFKSLVPSFFRQVKTIVIVFSAEDPKSFEKSKEWYDLIQKTVTDPAQIIMVQNMIDKVQNKTVSQNILDYTKEHNMQFCQCSAKTGEGVQELFNIILSHANSIMPELKQRQEELLHTIITEERIKCSCCE
ncbi:Rab11 [Hexamita inflata]|uniref:Rab11 n=1 Tax=Hexamita inflata TaxID=28002 RepID=A0AA86UHG9_9EUKA|nr:Rab11 [Hexamita inflata]